MSDENIHALRDEVERTREELADTVDELAAKFDVKSRVKESASGFKDSARESVTDPDGKPRPEVLSLAGGITALFLAYLVLKSLRRGR
ncbi:hypothetical protein AFL01nite_15090 [Aeromicrobium flavum]|uniref:DUF3618 domain-containing protein n=1 Tax=Aeromicrobium flavum TaxID=416568 RepID=A0A512HUP5_9ACTN|nr:DUF3618 domain-containing protein [Aeromicrobium flavum]GEO89182.1 hypothetical protein AFL01nite_15090 [Aeromicrobium flavum]